MRALVNLVVRNSPAVQTRGAVWAHSASLAHFSLTQPKPNPCGSQLDMLSGSFFVSGFSNGMQDELRIRLERIEQYRDKENLVLQARASTRGDETPKTQVHIITVGTNMRQNRPFHATINKTWIARSWSRSVMQTPGPHNHTRIRSERVQVITLVAAVVEVHLRQHQTVKVILKEKSEEKGIKSEGNTKDATIQFDFQASTLATPSGHSCCSCP